MMKACPTLVHYVYDFLENKQYSKGKGDFARKMDTFVNPLRSSMRNVSNAVKRLPDSLAEGMNTAADNMGRMSEKLGQDIKQSMFKVPPLLPKSDVDPEHCRVSAQLDDNVDDNIPLRVMLLLMDEVFDLKERNQWLRRNIKNLLQQLIRATYGDTINRKIVDHVDFMTAPEQVADYVKKFRDSYWPNGILAESPPRRDKNIRMRTRVAAKTNLLGIMPDELKHIIGADTTRKGILRVFDMFQHGPMNRRLVYVLLEGFLETMFPQYKFPELFVKLHSRSPRTARYTQKLKSTSLKR
nr:sorting nexin-13-like [Oncorhynchus nerka]